MSIPARYSSPSLNLEGRVTNLSTDGLFFSSLYLDGTGEVASLRLDMPLQEQPLELHGEVRWVKESPLGCGMGIRLIDVSLDDRILLAAVMSSQGVDTPAEGALLMAEISGGSPAGC